jgi:hypothetical protein
MNNSLINAVKEELGKDEYLKSTMVEVCNHGADCGFSGFIYHYETIKFFDDNKDDIITLAKDLSEDLGTGLLEMISQFNCLNTNYSVSEVAEVLFSNEEHEAATQIKNAMSWFALEEVSRFCVDNDCFEEDEQETEEEG